MNVEATVSEVRHSARDRIERAIPALRISLPFSERRALLFVGDAFVVVGAVLTALYLWARVDGGSFGLEFVRARWFWFPILAALWWFLAFLGDLCDVSVAGRRLEVARRIGLVAVEAVYRLAVEGAICQVDTSNDVIYNGV